MTSYVCAFVFSPTEHYVALMLKARPDWQAGKYNGIGGHIEQGESPLNAMRREWMEETDNKDATNLPDFRLFATLQPNGDFPEWKVYFFRANYVITNLVSSSEGESIGVVHSELLPDNCLPNLNWLIPLAKKQQSAQWPMQIIENANS